MDSNAVSDRIKQIIVQRINPGLKIEELRDDTPLIGRGVGLDSVSLLELVVALEADFGVLFDEKDMTPELFGSVASIASYVGNRTNHHQ